MIQVETEGAIPYLRDQCCECRHGANHVFAGRTLAQQNHTGRIELPTSSGTSADRSAQTTHLQETCTKHADIQDECIEAADLQDECTKDADDFMKAMGEAIKKTAVLTTDCPYHAPTLQLRIPTNGPSIEHDPLSRFLMEGTSEQSACFFRTDTGMLSVNRNCTCGRLVEQVAAAGHSNGP